MKKSIRQKSSSGLDTFEFNPTITTQVRPGLRGIESPGHGHPILP